MFKNVELRKRFAKDYNLPIKLFDDPYFYQRLELCSFEYPDVKEKWKQFVSEVSTFSNPQDYFEYYNKVKDTVMNHVKSKPIYDEFINCDFKRFSVDNHGIGERSVFKKSNDNQRFLSIDLVKANFTAMKYFNKELVDNKETYEDFIKQFTEYKHIIDSKYIRQVIFGNMNPKRQTTIEKYIMSNILEICLLYFNTESIQCYMCDEIVINISGFDEEKLNEFYKKLKEDETTKNIDLHVETYSLENIYDTDYYIQYFDNGKIKFKSLPALFYPFVVRSIRGEEVLEDDKVFFHEGYLSKFISVPKIKIMKVRL